MDESLQELENELKRLSPRRTTPNLLAALERELGPVGTATPARRYSTATSLHSWKWVTWSLAGAAAAALVALAVFNQFGRKAAPAPSAPVDRVASAPTPQPAPLEVVANRYEPIKASSVLYDLQESEPTTLPDRTEGREVRYRYVDTYTWQNPSTNASLRWSVPRDEVRLVRANLD
jgi:hypothetical protein